MREREKRDYDAIVIGSGPNGLSAAITLQMSGLSVLILEAKKTIGGGLRTQELTLPGFKHDVCSAIHPLALASPFFRTLPLNSHGLRFIHPQYAAAHPLDNGNDVVVSTSVEETAANLGADGSRYADFMEVLRRDYRKILADILGPLSIPASPVALTRFGLKALQPATFFARRFQTQEARAMWAGMSAHSMLPLNFLSTTAIGLVLLASAHEKGWPIPEGGSSSIATALEHYFRSIGGTIVTDFPVRSLSQLPSSQAVLFDTGPRQLMEIAGHRLSDFYRWQLRRYRYGMGVFKIDWALADPIPFRNEKTRLAGTVHIGNSMEEIALHEKSAWNGKHHDKPFVLLAQPSVFDPHRAPEGKHTAWAYCHTPSGSTKDMTESIEQQVERFAPGFRERILARNVMNSVQMQEYNPNYIGGDINGGAITLSQLFTRPALRWSPYRTSTKGLYLCSSSTPPGGGVHGMCGYHAAASALRDVFHIKPPPLAATF